MIDESRPHTMQPPQIFAGCATFQWNRKTDALVCDDTLVGLLGTDTAPRNRADLVACLAPPDGDRLTDLLSAAGDSSRPEEIEVVTAPKEHLPRCLNIRTQGEGETLHCLAVDVTRARHQASDNRTGRPQTDTGHYHYDIREGLSWWSGAMYRLFDVPPKPFMDPAGEILDRIHPDDLATAKQLVKNASVTLGPYEASYRIVRPDGSMRHVVDRGETEGPLDPETGLARNARGVITEISAERTARPDTQRATQAFEELIENAQFCIYLVDADMRIAHMSDGARPAFGDVSDIIGRDLGELLNVLWPAAFATEVTAQFRTTLATGRPYRSKAALEERKNVEAVESYDWSVQRVLMPDGRYGCLCHFYDLTELDTAVDTLRDDASTMQMIIDNAVAFIGVLEPDGALTEVNQPALIAGGLKRSDVINRKFWQAPWWSYSKDSVLRLKKAIVQARKGEVVRYDAEVLMSGNTMMTIDFMLSPIRDSAGRVVNIVASGFDITARKTSEDRIRMLMGEINHRSKNVLTLVQSIARLTDKSSHERFLPTFEGRLQALASSYDLLIQNEDVAHGASLGDLARGQLAHVSDIADGRVFLEGPEVAVTAEAAQGLSMAFHELATNAAKYGALSGEAGRVEVTWNHTDGGMLEVRWTESGGPCVRAPDRTGFGSSVLGPMAKATLNAEVDLRYEKTGVIWHARCGPECIAS